MVEWYGYVHKITGEVKLKRLFDRGDILEANGSPFVEGILGPFLATDRKSALVQLGKLYKEYSNG